MSPLNENPSSSHSFSHALNENIHLSTSDIYESSPRKHSNFSKERKLTSEDFSISKRNYNKRSEFTHIFKGDIQTGCLVDFSNFFDFKNYFKSIDRDWLA